MTQYRKKPVVIDAITFDELMQHGIEQCKAEGRESSIINGKPWCFTYKGHPISHERDDCYIIPTLESPHGHHMTPDDMLITGVAGELYPCKIDIFLSTYQRVDNTGLTFGQAIEALKDGKNVARVGWNCKGMWLALSGDIRGRVIPAGQFWSVHNADHARAMGGAAKVLPSITMKTADDAILMGWLASQTDMLAEDWMIVD